MIILDSSTRESVSKTWESGDIISSDRLNKIQDAIIDIADYIDAPGGSVSTELATKADITNALAAKFADDAIFGANLSVTGDVTAATVDSGSYKINGVTMSLTSSSLTVQSGFPTVQIELPQATSTTIGGVIVGSNLSVNEGIVSVPVATTAVFGVLKPAADGNINILNGDISVNIASSSLFGLVKIGDNINTTSGVISVPISSSSVTGLITPAQWSKLNNIEAGALVNVLSDWTESNTAAATFILNKPTLGDAAAKAVDTNISSNTSSFNLPTSKAVVDYIDAQDFLTTHQNIEHKLTIPSMQGLTNGEYILKLTLDNEGDHYSWEPYTSQASEPEPEPNGGEE